MFHVCFFFTASIHLLSLQQDYFLQCVRAPFLSIYYSSLTSHPLILSIMRISNPRFLSLGNYRHIYLPSRSATPDLSAAVPQPLSIFSIICLHFCYRCTMFRISDFLFSFGSVMLKWKSGSNVKRKTINNSSKPSMQNQQRKSKNTAENLK